LAGIDHEEDFIVTVKVQSGLMATQNQGRGIPFFLVHLFKGVRDVERADLLVVLEFKELISAVTSHVHKDV
jgi:hypothetical protein